MPRILKSLRKIHSYLGLLILPWIIAFGFTGFYLNHSELILSALPLNTYEDNDQAYMDLEEPLTLEQSANIARGYWPESKMLSVERISYHEQSAIEFKRENGSIIVVPKTGVYYVKSAISNKMFTPDGMLQHRKIYWNYIFGIFHRTGWLDWRIGTILADITAIALITFGISGLLIWYLPRHKRVMRRFSEQ